MTTRQVAGPGSMQRASCDNLQVAVRDDALQARIDQLEREAVLLREANEFLMIAALDAQTLRDDAEATNQRQNEFLAMLAHELRNPLAPIGMAAGLLARAPGASPQVLQMTGLVRRQVEHMARLLDDLLDAARISGGKIKLVKAPVALADVLAQAIETVMPRLKERRQQLVADVPREPVVTDADSVRLIQVFTNLLGNASKYTGDGGEVRLNVAVDGGTATVTVADNGTGIGADVLPHIFDLFTQGPRTLARSEGGLGVGLNVVKNLVTMHGGAVEACSAGLGQGTMFTVTLPVSMGAPARALAPPPASLAPGTCSVLLVEDNVDACETLQALLAMEGHAVATAHDGVAGLARAQAERFDVIVCDIGLPGLDGYEVLRRLRAAEHGAVPFAIALSGYGQHDDRTRARDAGFDRYLVKPIQAEALLELIASEECRRRRGAP
jgi:signal transduction histidine kinase/ActR/RegA family two-component response regulator